MLVKYSAKFSILHVFKLMFSTCYSNCFIQIGCTIVSTVDSLKLCQIISNINLHQFFFYLHFTIRLVFIILVVCGHSDAMPLLCSQMIEHR